MRTSVAAALLLFVAYGIFLAYGPRPAQVWIQSQWQENRYVVEKYLRMSHAPAAVVVGSSLTKRLDFQEDEQCIYNMALSGDSALTGVSVIAKSDKIPRHVLVEINLIAGGVNDEFVAKASGMLSRLSPVFYTENMPINLIYSFLRKPKSVEVANESILQLAFASQRPKSVDADVLDRNLKELQRLTRDIESRGTEIVFFEMPVNPDFDHVTQIQVRTAFRRAFQHSGFIGDQELSRGLTIKTIDGYHLRPDEATGVISNLQAHIKDTCIEHLK